MKRLQDVEQCLSRELAAISGVSPIVNDWVIGSANPTAINSVKHVELTPVVLWCNSGGLACIAESASICTGTMFVAQQIDRSQAVLISPETEFALRNPLVLRSLVLRHAVFHTQ